MNVLRVKKRFKTKLYVKRHEQIHTGEVSFECKACKKRFTHISNLKRHEKIHAE